MVSIESLKRQYEGMDDEFMHEAELLIIMFNFWPEVQRKWLRKLGLKEKQISKVMRISDLYAKKKTDLIKKKVPLNRKGVILIENDVIESLYEPRLIRIKDEDKKKLMSVAEEWIKDEHPDALIMNHEQIDKLEKIINLEDRSVDLLVFTKNKVISYQLELI